MLEYHCDKPLSKVKLIFPEGTSIYARDYKLEVVDPYSFSLAER
jgi:hypothetical protein